MSSSSFRGFISLPEDTITSILRLLDPEDLCSISYTCKFLRDLSRPTRFRDVEVYQTAFHKLCDL
ncbi:F-box protein, partial [Microbacterium plantarum]